MLTHIENKGVIINYLLQNSQVSQHNYKAYKFSELLKYRHYDAGIGLFFNQDNVGFVVETEFLSAYDGETQRKLLNSLQNLIPKQGKFQLILFADPHISDFLYKLATNSEFDKNHSIMDAIARQKVSLLKNYAFKSPNESYALRDFKCLICFSQSNIDQQVNISKFIQLKHHVQAVLEKFKISAEPWNNKHLITTLNKVINLDPDNTDEVIRYNRSYYNLVDINEQIGDYGSYLIEYGGDYLQSSTSKFKIRMYQAQRSANLDSLQFIDQLAQDNMWDKITCPFILTYAVESFNKDQQNNQLKVPKLQMVLFYEQATGLELEKLLFSLKFSNYYGLQLDPNNMVTDFISCLPMM